MYSWKGAGVNGLNIIKIHSVYARKYTNETYFNVTIYAKIFK